MLYSVSFFCLFGIVPFIHRPDQIAGDSSDPFKAHALTEPLILNVTHCAHLFSLYNFHNPPLNNSLAECSLGAKLFDNTQSIKDQVVAMDARTVTLGFILSNGYQDVCEVPANYNFYIIAMKYSNASAIILGIRLGATNASGSSIYMCHRANATWSDWFAISGATTVSTTSVTSEDA